MKTINIKYWLKRVRQGSHIKRWGIIYKVNEGRIKRVSPKLFIGVATAGLFLSFYPILPAEAAISQVQSPQTGTCSGTGSCNASATVSSATTDNLLIAVCSGRAQSGAVTFTVSGFTSAAGSPAQSGNMSVEIFYKVATGGETTITCATTGSGSTVGLISISEYSGTATATVVEGTPGTSSGTGTTITTGSTTTTNSNTLIIAGVSQAANTSITDASWTSSFIEQSDHNSGGGGGTTNATADRIVSSSGAYSTSATSGSSASWVTQIAAFNDDGGGTKFSIITQEGYTIENDDGTTIGAAGGITQEQKVEGGCSDSDGGCTATTSISQAQEDNLLVMVCHAKSQTNDITMTASAGWSAAVGPTTDLVSGARYIGQAIYYKVAAGSETSVDCTNNATSGNVQVWTAVFEYSGMENASVVDQTAENSATGTSLTTSSTATTTNDNDLLIAGFMSNFENTFSTWGDFTEETEQSGPDPGAHGTATASRVVSATGAYAATATVGTSTDYIGQLAAFKAGTSGVTGDPDETTAVAGSEFSSGKTISSVRAGERMILRLHLSNTGNGAVAANDRFAIFYDNDDGLWSRVNSVAKETGGSNCDSSDFDCTDVITTDDVGSYSDIVIGPGGLPWIVYHDDTNDDLEVARYVGSGGSGCASTAWECDVIDSANDVGKHASIAMDASGKAWVSFYDATNGNLEVAQYVGSGGSGCGSSAWTCESVDSTDDVGQYNSIAIDGSGNPWVSFYDATGGNLLVAEYVGDASGSCDDTDWDCTDVATTDDVGLDTSINFHPNGTAWVSYFDTTGDDLIVAENVGTGGSNCATSEWDCTDVYTSGVAGEDSSIGFDGEGSPWISFYHNDNDDLIVAEYVGSGGTGCATAVWDCTSVDTTNMVGKDTSLQFDVSGAPAVVYQDITNTSLKYARYVGSGGSCDSSEWDCISVESTNSTGEFASLAFDLMGRPWVSYATSGSGYDLHVARLARSGQIINSAASTSSARDTLTESHADMGSATDATNRDDADCLAGSATWNNGVWTGGNITKNVDLPVGDVTTQCTEITFVIDTSQAVADTTYRFVVATSDSYNPGKSLWRGPSSVAADGYPEITVSTAGDQTFRYAKGIIGAWDTACDDTDWECTTLTNDANNSAVSMDMVSDKNGKIWVAHNDGTGNDLEVGAYVGNSGSNCANAAWDCDTLDATGTTGISPAMAVDNQNNPWISYRNDNSNLEVAKYVGSGGDCSISSWECQEIDDGAATIGIGSSITFDEGGNAWISYLDVTNSDLKLARYVGENGTGCAAGVTDWSCEKIDDITSMDSTNAVTSIKVSNGIAWIAYTIDGTDDDLYLARYVGSGGSGCASEAWDCGAVYDTSVEAGRLEMTLDNNGDPWVAFEGTADSGAVIAEYVGTSGSGCASGVTDWNCVEIENTDVDWIAISADSEGDPWVVYTEASGDKDLIVAQYWGSGGSGCTSSAWNCTGVDTTTTTPSRVSMTFDAYGAPWVAYESDQGGGDTDVLIARLGLPPNKLSADTGVHFDGTRAASGDAAYRLDSGSSPYSIDYSSCGSSADYQGYCGLDHPEGSLDTINVNAKERPIYTFAASFGSNSLTPSVSVHYQTDLAPNTGGSTGDVVLQIYRGGSVNSWETIGTDSTNSNCDGVNCFLSGTSSGTTGDYFESIEGRYWAYFRIYQTESATDAIIFQLDSFRASQPTQLMRHGATFRDTQVDAFLW